MSDLIESARTSRRITYAIVVGVCVFAGSIVGSCTYRAKLRADMVSGGANPIDVFCMESSLAQAEAIICAERARKTTP